MDKKKEYQIYEVQSVGKTAQIINAPNIAIKRQII
jgi:hypothetical protein